MDYKVAAIAFLSFAGAWALVSALINSAANKVLKQENDSKDLRISELDAKIKSKNSSLVTASDTIADLEHKLRIAELTIQDRDVQIAELEGKLSAVSKTNTKLLKEVADDITVNVKAGDDVPLNIQKPKRRKPYKNSKPNAGSTSNNRQTGKKK